MLAIASDEPPIVEEVVIEAEQQTSATELGLSVVELSGEELVTKLGATLGETLANEPGVHNASYGPGVGLPVLRGLSGVRVRLSEDGIGAWDASSISPDHATAIEPILAEKIQVVKGAATVIHGNNAVGGTVEVTNGRIADELTGQPVSIVIEERREVHNDHDRESHVGKIKTELGKFVFQLDGFTRDSEDMSIPDVAIQEEAIEAVFGISNTDNTFETVLNSDSDSRSGSAAISFVDDDFYIGAATTVINSEYGIPPGAHTEPPDSPGHNHSHPVGGNIVAQARVRIDLEQERNLIKLGGNLNYGALESYQITGGKITYLHREFELDSTGLALGGVNFSNDVIELKAELEHSGLLGAISRQSGGRTGLQWVDRDFSAESDQAFGGEDYIPATSQQAVGLFAYEQLSLKWASLELGARYEWQEITQRELTAPLRPDDTQFFHEPIRYQTYTFSGSLSFDIGYEHMFTLNLNSAQRAPEIQELLSLGPHYATRSYDIGLLLSQRQNNQGTPKPETLNGLELRWELQSERLGELNTTLFYTEANDFIYQERRALDSLFDTATQQFTGNCTRLEQCIAVFRYTQRDVTFEGYEWQWLSPTLGAGNGGFEIEIFGDFVRGTINSGGDVPRMPPRRQGIAASWENPFFNAELRYSYVSGQDRAGNNETTTEPYKLLDAKLSYAYTFDRYHSQEIMAFVQMKNLLDEEIRKSTSFLRNFTPEPGREITLGLRYQF